MIVAYARPIAASPKRPIAGRRCELMIENSRKAAAPRNANPNQHCNPLVGLFSEGLIPPILSKLDNVRVIPDAGDVEIVGADAIAKLSA